MELLDILFAGGKLVRADGVTIGVINPQNAGNQGGGILGIPTNQPTQATAPNPPSGLP